MKNVVVPPGHRSGRNNDGVAVTRLVLNSTVLEVDGPLLVGVLNATPDSFSDGGLFRSSKEAVERGLQLVSDGAHVVDVGGESTRPGALSVSLGEELRRVLPVVSALAAEGVAVSIDTRHAEVAEAAIEHGAAIVNDVSGLRHHAMREVIARHHVPVVIVHSPVDDPSVMQQHSQYDDVVAAVVDFLRVRIDEALRAGISQVIVDPGIGFGKTTAQNLEILRRLEELSTFGVPVLVGASRKRFIGEITGVDVPADRIIGSVVAHLSALDRGASMLRVHDVRAHVEAVRMWQALRTGSTHSLD